MFFQTSFESVLGGNCYLSDEWAEAVKKYSNWLLMLTLSQSAGKPRFEAYRPSVPVVMSELQMTRVPNFITLSC